MKWYEPLLIFLVFAYVIYVIVSNIQKKKRGESTCECGKPISHCTGDCSTCASCNMDTPYLYTIHVDGMKCGQCEAHIDDVIRRKFPVTSVKSSRKRCVTVVMSKEEIDVKEMKNTIRELGYTV